MTSPAALRKLDAQVAALMGDVLVTEGVYRGLWTSLDGSNTWHDDSGPALYSTDATAMMRLIAHLRSQGWSITLDIPARAGRQSSCNLWRGKTGSVERHYAAAPALPEAVARAAVMAMGDQH